MQAMRNLHAIAAIAVLLSASDAAWAEAMPTVPMLDQLVRSDDAVFAMVSGRVSLVGGGFGTRSTSSTGPAQSESLQMRFTEDETFLSYQLNIPTEVFLVTVSAKQAIRLERRPTGKASFRAVTYVQKPGQEVVLLVGSDERTESIEAPSLWHLLLAVPDLCREHLLPMLATLSPHWDLEEVSKEIERGLLQGESSSALADRSRWTALLDQLADDSFARREAADRELRAAGPAALGYLRRLSLAALMPEQQHRIRRMMDAGGSENGNDTVDEVIAWLSGDAHAWLALADRPELASRQTAATRLGEILGEPIAFDPQAAPADRARQIDALRERLR